MKTMGCNPTIAADNMFCKCRKAAAMYNERLNSREGAAELLSLSPSTLASYELGLTKTVPVENVALMAGLYHAPELKLWYCKEMCPLGEDLPEVNLEELDRITVRTVAKLRKANEVKESLLDITEDGCISEEERPQLYDIVAYLKEVSALSRELALWAEKQLQEGDARR